jgi:hypothetical protein
VKLGRPLKRDSVQDLTERMEALILWLAEGLEDRMFGILRDVVGEPGRSAFFSVVQHCQVEPPDAPDPDDDPAAELEAGERLLSGMSSGELIDTMAGVAHYCLAWLRRHSEDEPGCQLCASDCFSRRALARGLAQDAPDAAE